MKGEYRREFEKARDTVFSRASAARNMEIISMYVDGMGYKVIDEKPGW